MKKEVFKSGQESQWIKVSSDKVSKALLISAVLLYSISLVLLANLALAGERESVGALIKVNHQLTDEAYGKLNGNVKSVHGNILSMDISLNAETDPSKLQGVYDVQIDHAVKRAKASIDNQSMVEKFEGATVVVGVLDNHGNLNAQSMVELQKLERNSNVGFVSYISDQPGSTVIMRNLIGGESNLLQSLNYMHQYAQTVGKPLVIEASLSGDELSNPLFVQVCQKMADAGVQFLEGDITGFVPQSIGTQYAFSTYDLNTGQLIDQSDYWTIEEMAGQKMMLLGSDQKTCTIDFVTESGFGKMMVANKSDDLVLATAITTKGTVHYFNIENKNCALIARDLFNGTPILEDGFNGILPFLTQGVLFNKDVGGNQMVALSGASNAIDLETGSDMGVQVGSSSHGTLNMEVTDFEENLVIEIKDRNGDLVYRNKPKEGTKSLTTKIDLSDGVDGLYFLDLTSPKCQQTFALLMD